jgi:uncharacterized membrane protein YfcA
MIELFEIMLSLMLLLISVLAGFLGSILGLGGGTIVVPFLTLVLGVDIRYAIAASLISIVATSSGAAASFLRDHLTNLRVAVLLEVGTVVGAMTGFLITSSISSKWLYLVFGIFLFFSAVMMLLKKKDSITDVDHPWSKKLNLAGNYKHENGQMIEYKVDNVPFGLITMFFAGIMSALLGIGSGIFKVLAMDNAMKMPLKVSSATSNFMIGVTAAGSAGAFLLQGDIRPDIACPVALGIIVGAFVGGKTMPKMKASTIRKIFVVAMGIVAFQMLKKGLE